MRSLVGHLIVDCGSEKNVLHVTLDDGRTIIFVGLGILPADGDTLH